MTPTESIIALFESINLYTGCLWVTGFILFAVEFFQPMRGMAYLLGSLLLGGAFITVVIYGSPGQAFFFLLFTAAALYAVHVVSLATQKRDWLRVARMGNTGDRRSKYDSLVDKVGIANTPIDLTGNAIINDVNLVVYSETPIAQGERVRVVKVTRDRIIVERAYGANNADNA